MNRSSQLADRSLLPVSAAHFRNLALSSSLPESGPRLPPTDTTPPQNKMEEGAVNLPRAHSARDDYPLAESLLAQDTMTEERPSLICYLCGARVAVNHPVVDMCACRRGLVHSTCFYALRDTVGGFVGDDGYTNCNHEYVNSPGEYLQSSPPASWRYDATFMRLGATRASGDTVTVGRVLVETNPVLLDLNPFEGLRSVPSPDPLPHVWQLFKKGRPGPRPTRVATKDSPARRAKQARRGQREGVPGKTDKGARREYKRHAFEDKNTLESRLRDKLRVLRASKGDSPPGSFGHLRRPRWDRRHSPHTRRHVEGVAGTRLQWRRAWRRTRLGRSCRDPPRQRKLPCEQRKRLPGRTQTRALTPPSATARLVSTPLVTAAPLTASPAHCSAPDECSMCLGEGTLQLR